MSFGGLLGSLYGDLPPPKTDIGTSNLSLIPKPLTTQSIPAEVKNEPSAQNNSHEVEDLFPTVTDNQIYADTDKKKALASDEVTSSSNNETQSTSAQKTLKLDNFLLPAVARRRARASAVSDKVKLNSAKVVITTHDTVVPAVSPCPVKPDLPVTSTIIPQSVVDEYDPSHPNNYDEYIKECARERRRQEDARRKQEQMESLREEQRKLYPTDITSSASLEITGDEAWQRRAKMSAALFGADVTAVSSTVTVLSSGNTSRTQQGSLLVSSATVVSTTSNSETYSGAPKKKAGFAQKMLEKMGWKEGEGLGRDKQGIVAPLVARKTDKRSGVIVQGSKAQQPKLQVPQVDLKNATRILLLANMVGKGEIDAELESETIEEGAKYGNLLGVKIIQLDDAPDSGSVRIFCEYESVNDAILAFQGFNNRLFGGRHVKAHFYSEEAFVKEDFTAHVD